MPQIVVSDLVVREEWRRPRFGAGWALSSNRICRKGWFWGGDFRRFGIPVLGESWQGVAGHRRGGDAMAKPRDDRQKDLLRPALEQVIDLGHPLVRLAQRIDWGFLDWCFSSVCAAGDGRPPLPTRLVAGLLILKHMHSLSDEALCAGWLENPYYQFFCGELSFCHRLPFDRSSLTHWRQRLGRGRAGGLNPGEPVGGAQDRGAGDTGPRAGGGRHDSAAQSDRPPDRRRTVSSGFGKAGRAGAPPRRAVAPELWPSGQARGDHGRATATRISSSGRGAPSNFCASDWAGWSATSAARSPATRRCRRALPICWRWPAGARSEPSPARSQGLCAARPRGRVHRQGQGARPLRVWLQGVDRDTGDTPRAGSSCCTPRRCTVTRLTALGPVVAELEQLTGVEIRREMKRRATVEPVIGHLKAEHRMGRNHLKGRDGDRTNAILAAAGYNFALLLRCLARLLRALPQGAPRVAAGPGKSLKLPLRVLHERRPRVPANTR